jgi:hypothetical protein
MLGTIASPGERWAFWVMAVYIDVPREEIIHRNNYIHYNPKLAQDAECLFCDLALTSYLREN